MGAGGEEERGGAPEELRRESEVEEEREVEEEETDTEDSSDDFLSGTLGRGRPPEEGGEADRTKVGTGVPAVGVLDWEEYPLEGEVSRCTRSGEEVRVLGFTARTTWSGTLAVEARLGVGLRAPPPFCCRSPPGRGSADASLAAGPAGVAGLVCGWSPWLRG